MNLDDRKARLIDPTKLDSEGVAGGATHKGIISKEADGIDLNVYYSRIQPGQTHDWHHHEEDEVIFCISGSGRYDLDDGEIVYGSGQFIFMPKGTRHCNYCTSESDTMLVAIFQPARN